MRRIIILIAAFALFAAGCATTMVPIGSNTSTGKNAVDLIVGQEYPRFHRDDPYTPIHVTFRNNLNRKVSLKHAYFTLIDPLGRKFVIAPTRNVVEWVRYDRWRHYYAPYYPSPVGRYVFREGRMLPRADLQAVMFFHQATHVGQGTYTLVAHIPENRRPIEFKFRLD